MKIQKTRKFEVTIAVFRIHVVVDKKVFAHVKCIKMSDMKGSESFCDWLLVVGSLVVGSLVVGSLVGPHKIFHFAEMIKIRTFLIDCKIGMETKQF